VAEAIDSVLSVIRERDTLRAAFMALPDAVVVVDPDGRTVLRNRRFVEWFGVDESRLPVVGSNEDHGTVRRGRVTCLDGQSREVDWFTAPVRGSTGDLLARLYSYHDVGSEVELARTTTSALSDLSHALRSPLASVVGFAELLLARDYSTTDRHQLLRLILEEGWRLASIIEGAIDPRRGGEQHGSPESPGNSSSRDHV
jgi:signal transduction histidine kinase